MSRAGGVCARARARWCLSVSHGEAFAAARRRVAAVGAAAADTRGLPTGGRARGGGVTEEE